MHGRGSALLLLLVFQVVGTFAHIHSPHIPHVEAGEARRIAHTHPSRIGTYDPEAVYGTVSLDATPHHGTNHTQGWANPAHGGGSMLDLVGNGFREPINVIISGRSDRSVLSEQGLLNYVRSIGFSFECLHIHLGGLQHANLGDGNGWVPQLFEYRSLLYPGSPGVWLGSCWESLAGGNHFRVWRQNGSHADTGAWFLAVSKEESVAHQHTIVPNGYDHGRDLLVAAATRGSTFRGTHWRATLDWAPLLPQGQRGINHNISIDGHVAILTVHSSKR